MDFREKSPGIRRIARRLIAEMPDLAYIDNSQVRIAYLRSDMEKKKGCKLVFGQCEKIPDKFKWRIPYDFMITVFSPNAERLTRQQMRVLLFHELLHIGIEEDGNEEKYYIRDHDYEEFREIIERYGLEWSVNDTA